MKKLRKIVAAVLATATVATVVSITASAADIMLGKVTPTADYRKAPTIHYSELSDFFDNDIVYSSVSSSLGRDNVVLSVDFTEPGSQNIRSDVYNEIQYYMENIYLKDTNGKFLTENKYPLVIDQWSFGDNGRVNVIVGSNDIFKGSSFDISNVRFYLGSRYDGRKERDVIQFNFKFKGSAVLPSYKVTIGNTLCDVRVGYNYIDDIDNAKCRTTGKLTVYIPHTIVANGETTVPMSINGVKVADITLSASKCCPVYKNY
ncbi:MAG: hypothetical protein E7490_07820 [Ruminococcaceae bacterium]|nr:hypothetical protein [Oscillospiraceae bacterium]